MNPTTSIFLSLFVLFSHMTMAQDMYTDVLSDHNKGNVPHIKVEELIINSKDVIFLDAREKEEFKVSHIPDAIYVGFEDFNIETTIQHLTDPTKKIVVYCSIGVRSETISQQLKAEGYDQVYNLYGGIFEWVNQERPLANAREQLTDSIHAYSRHWGKFLNRGIKVYE